MEHEHLCPTCGLPDQGKDYEKRRKKVKKPREHPCPTCGAATTAESRGEQ